jgi:hypothetical protein
MSALHVADRVRLGRGALDELRRPDAVDVDEAAAVPVADLARGEDILGAVPVPPTVSALATAAGTVQVGSWD